MLVALVVGLDERARVRDSLRGRASVRFVDSVPELLATLDSETRPLVGVLVEPRDRDDRDVAATVRALRARLRRVPLIGYCRAGHEHSSAILALAAAGVHELVFRGIDDSGVALRGVLGAAEHSCVAETLLGDLLPLLPATLHPFARYCIAFPQRAHTVGEVASALGVNRKTLVNYAARSCLPTPATLLAWCRVLLAAHYLASTTRTVERIALQLDFASATALRNMIKRYTGLRALDLRAQGGSRVVLSKLSDAVARRRARGTGHG